MIPNRNIQIRWLALLTVAVLLPTVSLLWFMSRVVANERLVIQQKVAGLYQDRIAAAGARVKESLEEITAILDSNSSNPYVALRSLVSSNAVQGLVLHDSAGGILYPRVSGLAGDDVSSEHALAVPWELELGKQQFAQAAEAYERLQGHADPSIAIAARLGRARCLVRLERLEESIEVAETAAFPNVQALDTASRMSVQRARLFLVNVLSRYSEGESHRTLQRRLLESLLGEIFNIEDSHPILSPAQNVFLAHRVLHILKELGADPDATRELQEWIRAEERSLTAAANLDSMLHRKAQSFPVLVEGEKLHALETTTRSGSALLLLNTNGLAQLFASYRDVLSEQGSAFEIFDSGGAVIVRSGGVSSPAFTTATLPDPFGGWKIALHFQDGDVFERAAQRQITTYLWTGALVILLILVAAALATQAIGRQIRLNQMKNNFIATVSHELKTPLASMRVLVDTLLEGNVRDDSQARQYLRMTARENERLSRLIDRFLTFSRMERNKAAFNCVAVDAADIVNDAMESLQTKFADARCPVELSVSPGLPQVIADRDAMVTVLVNLLENACKYSGSHKRIGLTVSAEAGSVSFAVSDNGIGLHRRHLRRIFDRFYQVDNSLARQVEGCGLGLSIVKFIVDGHKGRVTVKSQPGEGSTFTVQIPAALPSPARANAALCHRG
ncbi:MAG TPA: HAMP domain-containing sensor histidine kinase [Verrucomicrobiae bacterium]|nr:HAMP domain-containing sensor histidine kinase [Verrucomicrobiae bacterium]